MSPTGYGLLPGDNYPNWLTFGGNGSSLTFNVPQVDGRSLKTIMCIVYSSSPGSKTSEGLKVMLVINCTKNTIQLCKSDALLSSFDEEEWQEVVSNLEPGNIVKVIVVFGNGVIVKKTTVYLIYDEPIDEKMKHCHEPDKNAIVSCGDENIFGRLFFALPSLARTIQISRPFLFFLTGIKLWWSRCRSDKQRRSCNPILREMTSESSQGFNNPVSRDEILLGDVHEEVKRQGKKRNRPFPEGWVHANQQGIDSNYFKFLKSQDEVAKQEEQNTETNLRHGQQEREEKANEGECSPQPN